MTRPSTMLVPYTQLLTPNILLTGSQFLIACACSFTTFSSLIVLSLGVLTVVNAQPLDNQSSIFPRATQNPWQGTSVYKQIGTSGVSAMQMAVVDDKFVIIFDKAEHNPLTTSNGKNAWGALLNTHSHTVRALSLKTNSFCAGEYSLYQIRRPFLLTALRC